MRDGEAGGRDASVRACCIDSRIRGNFNRCPCPGTSLRKIDFDVPFHWIQDRPEEARDKLEALLKSMNVEYSYSKVSKFANFVNKTLL